MSLFSTPLVLQMTKWKFSVIKLKVLAQKRAWNTIWQKSFVWKLSWIKVHKSIFYGPPGGGNGKEGHYENPFENFRVMHTGNGRDFWKSIWGHRLLPWGCFPRLLRLGKAGSATASSVRLEHLLDRLALLIRAFATLVGLPRRLLLSITLEVVAIAINRTRPTVSSFVGWKWGTFRG